MMYRALTAAIAIAVLLTLSSCAGKVYCDTGGMMPPTCATSLVPGLEIPQVSSYHAKSSRSGGDYGSYHTAEIYYSSDAHPEWSVIVTVHPAQAALARINAESVSVNGYDVRLWGTGSETYNALTIVHDLQYQVAVLHLPDDDPSSVVAARDAFLEAITRKK